ncbi:MAG: hypothetical protein M3069_02910 [Chloroflexota bacterium]|nr:hypothetical protein [Chloroflexota bacterium]
MQADLLLRGAGHQPRRKRWGLPVSLPEKAPCFSGGVITQPSHATSDWRAAEAHWGVRLVSRLRLALRSGGGLDFGTDAPVEPTDPVPSL